MAARDIYLIRHAQSEWNAAGRWQGQADPPLSEFGRQQAQDLARRLPDIAVTTLLASDLQRATDTAQPLAERFALPLETDARLRELDVGNWSGYTRPEIEENFPGKLDLFFQGREGWEGGERYADHAARAQQVADHFTAMDEAETVVAVTHGGTLRAILLALIGIDHDLRWRFTGIGHTSVTHVTQGNYGYQLVSFNNAHDPNQL